VPVSGLGFRRGSYKCVCKVGYYYPDVEAVNRYFNGTHLEEEYAKILEVIENKKKDRRRRPPLLKSPSRRNLSLPDSLPLSLPRQISGEIVAKGAFLGAKCSFFIRRGRKKSKDNWACVLTQTNLPSLRTFSR